MQARTVAVVVGAVLLVGLGAFGVVRLVSLHGASATGLIAPKPTTCSDAYKVLRLKPSEVAAATPVCLNQSLQLSGEVVGSIGQAYPVDPNTVAPTQMCSTPKRWNGFPAALIAFVAGGKGYRLRISAPGSSEHQALTFNSLSGVVDLASISKPSQDWNQATGTLTLNSDATTGTIDASLLRDVNGAAPVRISGHWACGAPLPLPAFDVGVPCSGFYAINHLQDADIARMKASACEAQALSFTGDLNTELDHAITDTAISPHTGIDGDNSCAAGLSIYSASFKFSVGDESFLLDLYQYPATGPGQYSGADHSLSPGAFLWLGYADPNNQGLFVPDYKVFWSGTDGVLTINPDMKSGTIDVTLTGGSLDHVGSTVHVKGSWRCAP